MTTASPPVVAPTPAPPGTPDGEPMWDVLKLFPQRGGWTEADYFSLDTNRLVELVAGSIEVLPMPTELHQNAAWLLCTLLKVFVKPDEAAMALMAPFSIRLWPGHIRQPDVVYMAGRNAHRRHGNVWDGADLAIEIVSDDDPNRDLRVKRAEYAVARIPEYWIIDPRLADRDRPPPRRRPVRRGRHVRRRRHGRVGPAAGVHGRRDRRLQRPLTRRR